MKKNKRDKIAYLLQGKQISQNVMALQSAHFGRRDKSLRGTQSSLEDDPKSSFVQKERPLESFGT